LSAVSAGKKQSKQVRKIPEIRKNLNFEVVLTFFGKRLVKYWHNPQIFKSLYRSRNSSVGHFDEVSARNKVGPPNHLRSEI